MENPAYTGRRTFDYRLRVKSLNNAVQQTEKKVLPGGAPGSDVTAMQLVNLASTHLASAYR